ncbi:ClpX C4-type zinc finger protein [Photorhabdus temperata]|uniref:ClpX C4-type zinc finger protein n=1 Tax=Photorhabdus temperata TaxID=574560 RepID=UPI0030873A7F|nr:ClpX C4-type zinc finger protein [Photorhabdus temperata]
MIAGNKHWCNFCGKSQDEVNAIASGMNNSDICNECIIQCVNVLINRKSDEINESTNITDSTSHQ